MNNLQIDISQYAASCAQLRRMVLMHVSGKDAAMFLQKQLSNNVLQLDETMLGRGSYSSAKGMVYTNFTIIRTGAEFLVRLSADIAKQVMQRLSMFILRDDVKIRLLDMPVFGISGVDATKVIAKLKLPIPDVAQVALSVTGSEKIWVVASNLINAPLRFEIYAQNPSLLSAHASSSDANYMLELLQSGEVFVQQSCYEQYVAQMLNLDLINAVDFKKGCYPGQEYIARTQYRGQIRSRTAYLCADQNYQGDDNLFAAANGEVPIGTIINRENHGGKCYILACLRLKFLAKQQSFYAQHNCEFVLQQQPYDWAVSD